MGVRKPYGAREARKLLENARYKDGDVVKLSKGIAEGRIGEVEGVTLSSVDRGVRLYQVRVGRGIFDVVASREEDLTPAPK